MTESAETEFDYIKMQARSDLMLKSMRASQQAKIESLLEALQVAASRMSDMADVAEQGTPATPSFLRSSARRCEIAIELFKEAPTT